MTSNIKNMKLLKNAFTSPRANKCFACSETNDFGLKMKFYDDGDQIVSIWEPQPQFDGWQGVVHGGVQATLIDEVGEWFVFTKIGRSAVTMNLDIRYKKPVKSGTGIIKLVAKQISFEKNIATIDIKLIDNEGNVCSKAVGKYYVFSDKDSKEKFDFPGKEKFYE